jgi:hypothetical protein
MRHPTRSTNLLKDSGHRPDDRRDRGGEQRLVRRGVSLVVVLISISMSLMLTYAALNSQSRGWQVRSNIHRQALAQRAAQSGAAIALNAIQSPNWSGVASPPSGILESDADGTTSYNIEYLTIDGQASPDSYPAGQGRTSLSGSSSFFDPSVNGLSVPSAATAASATRQAFQLLIRSTGKWQSSTDPLDVVTQRVEVGVELQPRVPGRLMLDSSNATANDLAPNSGQYDLIQSFALFATAGSNGNPSVKLEPGHRIDGPSFLVKGINLFNGPKWKSDTRQEFLESTGRLLTRSNGGSSSFMHPHPFGGPVTLSGSLSNSESTDLSRLNVPSSSGAATPAPPTIQFAQWKNYSLVQGGFRYSAELLNSSTLSNVVLRPSPRNPLGIFFTEGNLTVDDQVVVQGTLVCTGRMTFSGRNVHVESVNWRDETGSSVVASAELFPRLPAIVAQNLVVNSNTRGSISGAVLLTGTLTGSDGNYEFVSGQELHLAGSGATSAPIRQPYSVVQLPFDFDLSAVAPSTHAIWLADGDSGNWFPIVEVNAANRTLTILGEARRASPVGFRIRRQRAHCFDIRGPVMAARLQLSVSSAWKLSTSLWSYQFALWGLGNQVAENNGQPTTPFVTWVADSANYAGWGAPWQDVGLPLEPATHLRPQPGVRFRDSCPLFQGYTPPSNPMMSQMMMTDSDPAGLRWRVLFWREQS